MPCCTFQTNSLHIPGLATCAKAEPGCILQVNPHGRLGVPGGSYWEFHNVEISLLSFDWFVPQAIPSWPLLLNGPVGTIEAVHLDVVNSTLQCPKCAADYTDGMGSSWLETFGGDLEPVCPSLC